MKKKLPIGIERFEELSQEGFYYVDKTLFIRELLRSRGKVNLFTRPRRFGKSLNIDMLNCFFDIRKDSRSLFEGLAISAEKELCENWMNRYPTIFITLKNISSLSFADAYEGLVYVISQLYDDHRYLLEKDMSETDREMFHRILFRNPSKTELCNSLFLLTKLLEQYYGAGVILFVDEYDVPMSRGAANGYYREIADVTGLLLGAALKTNSCLKFAVLTGCLRIAKESIFTGLNNLYVDSISDSRFDEYFGFTDSEIDRLLEDTGLTQAKDSIREWYDGYRFGEAEVYCPWDVVNYISQLQYNPEARPKNFWANTSGNDIIRQFLTKNNAGIKEQLSVLLRGGTIKTQVNENLTYEDLTGTEHNFWSVLYLTGYLTPVRVDAAADEAELKIPNKEVRLIFENSVALWFSGDVVPTALSEISTLLWNCDEEGLSKVFSRLLFKTISYYDYSESFYHAFLAGIFAVSPYEVKSNRENGTGRTDITVVDADNARAAVFEFKAAGSSEGLESKCEEALKQIADRQYAEELQEDSYLDVICCGTAFYKKKCMVKIRKC